MEASGEYLDMTENSHPTMQSIHHVMRILVSHTFHQTQISRTGSSPYFIAYFNMPLKDLYSTV